jgi:hypothetical protein
MNNMVRMAMIQRKITAGLRRLFAIRRAQAEGAPNGKPAASCRTAARLLVAAADRARSLHQGT